ncbi:hypothetical protein ACIBQ6_09050 [Nonomuraea sp. NPDC049655]|uniref:hypothetical protein n=1 Tax=Nonomuraea sp. NPDC049655 TaxID=3364355 RepID=UPI0037BC78B7
MPEDPERDGQYLRTLWPTWSPDGRRLPLNVFEPGGEPRPVWGPTLGWYDERHLLAPVKDGVGVVDLTGRVVETLVKAGTKATLYPHFERRG